MTDGQYPDDEFFARPAARKRNVSSPSAEKPIIGFKSTEVPKAKKRLHKHAASSDPMVFRRVAVGGGFAVAFVILLAYGLVKGGSAGSSSSVAASSSIPATVGTASSLPSNQKVASSPSTVVRDSAPTTLTQSSPSAAANPASTTVAPPTTPRTTLITTTSTVVTTASAASSASSLAPGVNPANASITVRVANATYYAGAATTVTEELGRLDFNVLGPANASTSNPNVTIVYYSAGFQVAGDAIARILGVPQSQVKQYSSGDAIGAVAPSDVNVVLGTDIAAG
ncbi:MAG: LytR C-terminal domain-containing protein [Actinomycetota bacterium]|nr:LytR C-terminal domain-containing protein [Actinomycetota bacterium]